jgi:hypothetical protein
MQEFIWDGPEDSDEEVGEMEKYKNMQERQQGIKFSKRGLISFIENTLKQENPDNKEDMRTAKKWE